MNSEGSSNFSPPGRSIQAISAMRSSHSLLLDEQYAEGSLTNTTTTTTTTSSSFDSTVKKVVTPLPKKILSILAIIIFSEPVSLTILFPFIYFMVRDFGIQGKEVGFYVGFIASSFSLAQFLTSIFWGRLSDRIGRRPILLVGLLGNAITSTLFGLSHSLLWAILSRGSCGLVNGNVVIAKCVLSEVTDETNSALGFSIFGLCWGAGLIVGPMLGGFLSDPVVQFPGLFGKFGLFSALNAFLVENPYFLPMVVSAAISMGGFILGWFSLEETSTTMYRYSKVPNNEEEALESHTSIPSGLSQEYNEQHHEEQLFKNNAKYNILSDPLDTINTAQRNVTKRDSMATLGNNNNINSEDDFQYRDDLVVDSTTRSNDENINIKNNLNSTLFESLTASGPSNRNSTSTAIIEFVDSTTNNSTNPEQCHIKPDTSDTDKVVVPLHNRDSVMTIEEIGPKTGDSVYIEYPIIETENIIDQNGKLYLDNNNEFKKASQTSMSYASIQCIIAFGCLAFFNIIFDEIFALWMVTKLGQGGLGYSSADIGLCLSIMGIATLICQLVIFPRLSLLLTPLTIYRMALPVYVLSFGSLPVLTRLIAESQTLNRYTWVTLLCILTLRHFGNSLAFTTVVMLVSNSATRDQLGFVNGAAQTMASGVRAIGPALGGTMWSWSLLNGKGFPLDASFVFIVLAVISALGFFQSLFIPLSVNVSNFDGKVGGVGGKDKNSRGIAHEIC